MMSGGKTEVLISGYSTTNSLVYTGKFHVLGFNEASVGFDVLKVGSGVQYTIRGYPVEDFPLVTSIGSGTLLVSGATVLVTSGLNIAVADIDVGVASLSSGYSGCVTVVVAGKRR
jgi:hypothetical protein